MKIGSRMGEWTNLKGETVHGSALSLMLFMFILGWVLEGVGREKVEGVEVGACVDDVDFMVVGRSEREIEKRVRRMEVGLERGVEKWEVDVETMKLEGLWVDKEGGREGKRLKWLGEEMRRGKGGENVRGMVASGWGMRESCGEKDKDREYEVGIDEEIDRQRGKRSKRGGVDGYIQSSYQCFDVRNGGRLV